MSTQALENQTANVGGPTAEPRKATGDFKFEIEIFEENGYAAIKWTLDPAYAIGDKDMIYLQEDNKMIHEMRVVSHSTTWRTPHVWGSGLRAAYTAWNFEKGHGRVCKLVVTEKT